MGDLHHISRPKIMSPREGDSISTLHKFVDQAGDQAAELTRVVSNTQRSLFQTQKFARGSSSNLHPFKIYQVPSRFRAAPDPSVDWLKFRIRSGQITFNGSIITLASGKADGAIPDHEAYLTNPDGTPISPVPADIVAPAACAKYWFWFDLSEVSGSTVPLHHGGIVGGVVVDDDPAPTSAPTPTMVLIGYVDTLTRQAQNAAIIRQIARADIQSISGGSTVQMFKITGLAGDYVTAKTWDGTNLGGTNINIAKPPYLRESLTAETVDGVALTYTYTDSNNRVASDGTNSEFQVCYPRYVVGSGTAHTLDGVIFAAISTNNTDVVVSTIPVKWIEVLPSRVWARRYNQ